jgi:hypothetical protein
MLSAMAIAPRDWKHGTPPPGYDTRPPTRREDKSSSVVTLFFSGNSLWDLFHNMWHQSPLKIAQSFSTKRKKFKKN